MSCLEAVRPQFVKPWTASLFQARSIPASCCPRCGPLAPYMSAAAAPAAAAAAAAATPAAADDDDERMHS